MFRRHGSGHVTDDHRDRVFVDLGAELADHRSGHLDAGHRHAALSQGHRNPTGADGEFECLPIAGKATKEVDRLSEHPGANIPVPGLS